MTLNLPQSGCVYLQWAGLLSVYVYVYMCVHHDTDIMHPPCSSAFTTY